MVFEAVQVGMLLTEIQESSYLEKRLVAMKYTGREVRPTSHVLMQI